MKVALTGNPNSGKTTLFNAITGKIEKVGNWAGVTVDIKEGFVRKSLSKTGERITAVDLPGAYSMSPFTSEESITSEFICSENPDVIINIVDATNLSRSLFFTSQLLELGIPLVVALNKSDINKKKNTKIDINELSESLGCPVVETCATSGGNKCLSRLITKAMEAVGSSQRPPFTVSDLNKNDKASVEAADKERFEFIKAVVEQVESRKVRSNKQTIQDKVDRVVANRYLGVPIFIVIMWAVFSISQEYVGPFAAGIFGGWIDSFYGVIEGWLGQGVSPVLRSLLLDGIIGGVGAVVGFLPLIMVLFFLLALLEDCGYMARVAVIMDRYFKGVGLSGKSIIPMVIGTGCAIPGVMATRTIKNDRQRRTTVMLTPFMPCGAKLPVIAMFAGAFFKNAAWVGTSMYFAGIGIIIIGALVVVRITGEKNARSFFIMELPEYRIPSFKRAIITTLSSAKAFIIKAGTIILLCNAVVQIMQTFNWKFEMVLEGAENTSILASIASPFAVVLLPLGFGVWQLAAASITGFIAKENVVGTLAVVYSMTNLVDPEELTITHGGGDVASIMGLTTAAALAYLVFNLFTPPCFAAIGAMNAEMGDKKWFWSAVGFQFGMGYTTSFFVYHIGTLITEGTLGAYFLPGFLAVATLIGYIIYLMKKGDKEGERKRVSYSVSQ